MSNWLDEACKASHEAYENAAAGSGWETQERSRVPWESVPEANKVAMRAGIAAAMSHAPERRILSDLIEELRGLSGDGGTLFLVDEALDRAEARLREVTDE